MRCCGVPVGIMAKVSACSTGVITAGPVTTVITLLFNTAPGAGQRRLTERCPLCTHVMSVLSLREGETRNGVYKTLDLPGDEEKAKA